MKAFWRIQALGHLQSQWLKPSVISLITRCQEMINKEAGWCVISLRHEYQFLNTTDLLTMKYHSDIRLYLVPFFSAYSQQHSNIRKKNEKRKLWKRHCLTTITSFTVIPVMVMCQLKKNLCYLEMLHGPAATVLHLSKYFMYHIFLGSRGMLAHWPCLFSWFIIVWYLNHFFYYILSFLCFLSFFLTFIYSFPMSFTLKRAFTRQNGNCGGV